MAEGKITLDDAPLNRFHIKITGLTYGAHFTDGYALGIIATALILLKPQMQLTALWEGLLGSSALIGLFIGSVLLGVISDHIGRQKIFVINFVLITIASFLQFFVTGPVQLFLLRVLIGIGLGGDYAVGTTLLAEFAPRKHRAKLLSSLIVFWTFGYVAANLVGHYFGAPGPDAWRWLLASTTIPAVIVLLLRFGTPESPRWLISQGRVKEARAIVRKYISPNVVMDESHTDRPPSFRLLFTPELWKRTVFGSVFYVTLVFPYFAIYTFLPEILKKMNLSQSFTVSLLLNIFLAIGAIAGIWFTEKLTRRGYSMISFIFLIVTLTMMSILPSTQTVLLVSSFVLFTFVMSGVSNLTSVYIAELFPTKVRSSGVGFATAISRIGSALGTFLLPISLESYGFAVTLFIMVVVLFIGLVATFFWGPETKGLPLKQASKVKP